MRNQSSLYLGELDEIRFVLLNNILRSLSSVCDSRMSDHLELSLNLTLRRSNIRLGLYIRNNLKDSNWLRESTSGECHQWSQYDVNKKIAETKGSHTSQTSKELSLHCFLRVEEVKMTNYSWKGEKGYSKSLML